MLLSKFSFELMLLIANKDKVLSYLIKTYSIDELIGLLKDAHSHHDWNFDYIEILEEAIRRKVTQWRIKTIKSYYEHENNSWVRGIIFEALIEKETKNLSLTKLIFLYKSLEDYHEAEATSKVLKERLRKIPPKFFVLRYGSEELTPFLEISFEIIQRRLNELSSNHLTLWYKKATNYKVRRAILLQYCQNQNISAKQLAIWYKSEKNIKVRAIIVEKYSKSPNTSFKQAISWYKKEGSSEVREALAKSLKKWAEQISAKQLLHWYNNEWRLETKEALIEIMKIKSDIVTPIEEQLA